MFNIREKKLSRNDVLNILSKFKHLIIIENLKLKYLFPPQQLSPRHQRKKREKTFGGSHLQPESFKSIWSKLKAERLRAYILPLT